MNTELLLKVADCIKTHWELMPTKWCCCESESIAMDVLTKSAKNYREHGEAFMWAYEYLQYGSTHWNNLKGMRILEDEGAVTVESYHGKLKPNNRFVRLLQWLGIKDQTVQKDMDGNYLVIRPSDGMLEYAAEKLLFN